MSQKRLSRQELTLAVEELELENDALRSRIYALEKYLQVSYDEGVFKKNPKAKRPVRKPRKKPDTIGGDFIKIKEVK